MPVPVAGGAGTPLVRPAAAVAGAERPVFNALLTVVLLVGTVLEVMPLPALFALAFALALLVNHPTWEAQQALLEKHARASSWSPR
ncbi:hypothetical protein SALBM311S_05889 [Streptomyces alboniger]